jgi:predicted glycoside hydrolase/deacetylase ChbG (UPF0249 family)
MTNMPAFVEACEQARSSGLDGRIGMHLNLTQGLALTMPIRGHESLCRPDGEFQPRSRNIWRLSRAEAKAVEIELAAQIEASLTEGITPTHLDSHHHAHAQWPIGSIVISLARQFNIPAVRLSRNCGAGLSTPKNLYKNMFNARMARAGLAPTRWFGSARDVLATMPRSGPIEVMVHPERDLSGQVVDCAAGASVFENAEPLLELANQLRRLGRFVSYSELTSGGSSTD